MLPCDVDVDVVGVVVDGVGQLPPPVVVVTGTRGGRKSGGIVAVIGFQVGGPPKTAGPPNVTGAAGSVPVGRKTPAAKRGAGPSPDARDGRGDDRDGRGERDDVGAVHSPSVLAT